jgi:hypothetical protein
VLRKRSSAGREPGNSQSFSRFASSAATGLSASKNLEKAVDEWTDERTLSHDDQHSKNKKSQQHWRKPPPFISPAKDEQIAYNAQIKSGLAEKRHGASWNRGAEK